MAVVDVGVERDVFGLEMQMWADRDKDRGASREPNAQLEFPLRLPPRHPRHGVVKTIELVPHGRRHQCIKDQIVRIQEQSGQGDSSRARVRKNPGADRRCARSERHDGDS